jgi:hypothetical protein
MDFTSLSLGGEQSFRFRNLRMRGSIPRSHAGGGIEQRTNYWRFGSTCSPGAWAAAWRSLATVLVGEVQSPGASKGRSRAVHGDASELQNPGVRVSRDTIIDRHTHEFVRLERAGCVE